jgi:hypothetical protein
MTEKSSLCGICGRPLDQPDDPLSDDCGGDCWGCVGEIALGLRPAFGRLRPAGRLDED